MMLSHQQLEDRLSEVGRTRYHHLHPFHRLMHQGELNREQLQAWALNRYYYQSIIPQKDSLILAKSNDPEFRRVWRKRILDHDGSPGDVGGIEKWIRLAEVTGLERDYVVSCAGVLPAVKFAGDAYLDLVSSASLLESVASSLTEMFSARLISLRVSKMLTKYPFMEPGLEYFQARLTQAPEDASMALDYVKTHARTREQQDLVIAALARKCDILWAQLDALYYAYVSPGYPAPGSFMAKDYVGE